MEDGVIEEALNSMKTTSTTQKSCIQNSLLWGGGNFFTLNLQ